MGSRDTSIQTGIVPSFSDNNSQTEVSGPVQACAQIFSRSEIDEADSISSCSQSVENLSDHRSSVADYQLDLNTSGFSSYCVDPVNKCMVEPFTLVSGEPFSSFCVHELNHETSYQARFNNRSVSYYGKYAYEYAGGYHPPRDINPNSYLANIVEHFYNLYPHIHFNSVLITKYASGSDNLPFHQDNELEIVEDSVIATISLGETRNISFRSIDDKGKEISVALRHGQLLNMSRSSQEFFQHSIPKDFSKRMRVSITLRSLKENDNMMPPNTPKSVALHPAASVTKIVECKPAKTAESSNIPSRVTQTPSHQKKSTTIYLSDSMFRFLDEAKMSTKEQTAHVFFYSGATAAGILKKFKSDKKRKDVDMENVSRIYVLAGTNNVDDIARMGNGICGAVKTVSDDLYELSQYLLQESPHASVNFINLLPRMSLVRNNVINMLNEELQKICQTAPFLNFIDTELDRYLFSTRNGYRNEYTFVTSSNRIPDNVHLNRFGIIRLAKLLKYLAHLVT